MHTDPLHELAAQAPFLRRLAVALVRDEHDADDLVQETWVRALRSDTVPREDQDAPGGLARFLRDRARSLRRGRTRRAARELDAGRARAGGGADDATARVAERVLGAVLGLSEPYKTTVLRRYYEDLSPTEIARVTGVPLRTVESRLRRARAELRERLDDAHGGRAAWSVALVALAGVQRPAPLVTVGGALAAVAGAGALAIGAWALARGGGQGPEPQGARLVEAAAVAAVREDAGGGGGAGVDPEAAASDGRHAVGGANASAEAARASGQAAPIAPRPAAEPTVAWVRGRVTAPDGSDPWVAVVPPSPRAFGTAVSEPLAQGPCAPDGAFQLEVELGPRVPRDVRVVAVGRDRVPAFVEARLSGLEPTHVELALTDEGAVAEGFASHPNSDPMASAAVRFRREGSAQVLVVGGPYVLDSKDLARASLEVLADDRGRFVARGLSPGVHRVTVEDLTAGLEGAAVETYGAFLSPWLRMIEDGAGEKVTLPDAFLALRQNLFHVNLLVRGADGPLEGARACAVRPAEAARVIAGRSYDDRSKSAVSISGGLRVVYDPGDDRVALIERPGYRAAAVDPRAHPRGATVAVVLEPLGTAQPVLVVVRSAGAAPDVVDVELTSASRETAGLALRRRETLGGGPIEIPDVPRGSYWVRVTPQGETDCVEGVRRLDHFAEAASTVDVELPVGARVRLVARGDVESIAGAHLVLERDLPEGQPGTRRLMVGVSVVKIVEDGAEPGADLKDGEAIDLVPAVPPDLWDLELRFAGKTWYGRQKLSGAERFEIVIGPDGPIVEPPPAPAARDD